YTLEYLRFIIAFIGKGKIKAKIVGDIGEEYINVRICVRISTSNKIKGMLWIQNLALKILISKPHA
ncbi:hypothetical protein, partial [Helicobacter japonicus]|uniref:hypothetical protein n=1 Tax=Helicobacter japonicus TaxID=425400 RepID=UPI0025A6064B